MNRADRRKMMRKVPGYKSAVKNGARVALNDLERMFQKQWAADDDETLNEGDWENIFNDDWDDEIYND